MSQLLSAYANQLTAQQILALDGISEYLNTVMPETWEIKQRRLDALRTIGITAILIYQRRQGLHNGEFSFRSLVGASSTDMIFWERSMTACISQCLPPLEASAYEARVAVLQEGFYREEVVFSAAQASWESTVARAWEMRST